MSRLHECKHKEPSYSDALYTFLRHGVVGLVEDGHLHAVMRTIALLQQGEKPVRHIYEDEILPCYKEQALTGGSMVFDTRQFLMDVGFAEQLDLLVPGIVGPVLGSVHAGFSARGCGVALTPEVGKKLERKHVLPTIGPKGSTIHSPVKVHETPLLAPLVQEGKLKAKKNKRQASGETGGSQGVPKRRKASNKVSSEELKHDDEESELESGLDEDYDEADGFIAADDEPLEYDELGDSASSDSDCDS